MPKDTKAPRSKESVSLRVVISILVAVSLAVALSCGGGGAGNAGSSSPSTITSVSVSCNPTSVQTGQTSQCMATVTGTGSYGSTVTWIASAGTINSSGLVTAPNTAGSITVTATSTQDTTKSGTATVTVTVPVTITSVSVSCNPTSVQTGQTSQCTATVTGTGSYSSAVTWSASAGTINSSGLLTAPNTAGSVTVTATSTQDTTKSGTATVTVTVPVTITGVSITPASATLNSGTTQQLSATVSGTGDYNTTVSWSVCDSSGANCVSGGNSSYGTISTSGLYTTPILEDGSQALTVTVEAVANGNSSELASATLTVTVAAFSNGSLNGQYAFSLKDPTDSVFVAGSFAADGNGNLTQGVLDFASEQNPANALSSGSSAGTGTDVAFTGSYQIGIDGRGTLTFVSPLPANELPSSYDFVMVSTSEGRMVSTNVVWVSGAVFKQDTSAFSNAAIAGNYAFGYTELEPCGGECQLWWAIAGAFTADGNGNITAGTVDASGDEGLVSFPNFAGSYSIGPNGRGTITYTDTSSSSYALYTYIISASRMILVSVGPPVGCTLNCPPMAYAGEADQQTGLPLGDATFSGGYTFALSGFAGYYPFFAGQFTANGQNGIPEGEEDTVDNSPGSTSDVPFTGTFSEVSPNGRGTAVLDAGRFDSLVFYLISPSEAFLVSTDLSSDFGIGGKAYGQGNGPLTLAGNYAFSFAGLSYPTLGETIASGQFTADGAGTIQSGTVDFGNFGQSYQLTGTYPNIDSTGRGTMTLTIGSGVNLGIYDFAFYASSSSEITLIGVNADVLGSAKRQQ